MPTNHTVQPGECVSSIAKVAGFGDPQTVYGDGANAALRAARPNLNVLVPGDVVVIPDRLARKVPCDTSARHTFRVARKVTLFRMVLRDDGAVLAGKAYALVVAGGETFRGHTDAAGKIEHRIPADATAATLTFWLESADEDKDGYVIPVELGHLRPESDVAGARARLLNLAFDCGGVGDALDAPTQDALRGFQAAAGLTVNGTLDDATKARLRRDHEGG